MKRKSIFLILFTILAVLTGIIASVSAQDVDVDSMDNEQLTALLLQILNKLEQDETSAVETELAVQETPAPTDEPVPAADPVAIEEVFQITIYDNKKLIVEALPAHMFIQPTKESKSKDTNGEDTKTEEPTIYSEPTLGKPCAPAIGGYLYWGYCGHSTELSCGCG